MKVEELEVFNTTLTKLAAEAIAHYAKRYALYEKLGISTCDSRPEKLRFSHVDTTDVVFLDFKDGDTYEYVSLKSLLDQETDLQNLEHDLLAQVEEQKLRKAARLEREKANALEQINKLKERYGL